VRLAESWGIGGAKNNNGVLLLVSLGDRKVTIQTGYGVEGALPDAITKRIITREITPNFKAGDYFAGLDQVQTLSFLIPKVNIKTMPQRSWEKEKFRILFL
jgi:uncharacterized protein